MTGQQKKEREERGQVEKVEERAFDEPGKQTFPPIYCPIDQRIFHFFLLFFILNKFSPRHHKPSQ